MENAHLLIAEMAEKCRGMIERSEGMDYSVPEALHPQHLLWMCGRIEQHANDWPETKLHRWIGFVQGGMMANRILNLDEAKVMFDEVKNAYGRSSEDQDLIDHLDPNNPFKIDIGGQG